MPPEKDPMCALCTVRRGVKFKFNRRDQDADQGLVRVRAAFVYRNRNVEQLNS
jgi:hypothetical protein